MPNWCLNHIKDIRKEVAMEKLLKTCEDGKLTVDFNILRPMPESLRIDDNTDNDVDMYLYLSNSLRKSSEEVIADPRMQLVKTGFFSEPQTPEEIREWVKKYEERARTINENYYDEHLEHGRALIENYEKYGAPTWYEWACANWGTKWNVSRTDVIDNEDGTLDIIFYTAWGSPWPILDEVAKYSDFRLDASVECNRSYKCKFVNGEMKDFQEYDEWADIYEFREGAAANDIELNYELKDAAASAYLNGRLGFSTDPNQAEAIEAFSSVAYQIPTIISTYGGFDASGYFLHAETTKKYAGGRVFDTVDDFIEDIKKTALKKNGKAPTEEELAAVVGEMVAEEHACRENNNPDYDDQDLMYGFDIEVLRNEMTENGTKDITSNVIYDHTGKNTVRTYEFEFRGNKYTTSVEFYNQLKSGDDKRRKEEWTKADEEYAIAAKVRAGQIEPLEKNIER